MGLRRNVETKSQKRRVIFFIGLTPVVYGDDSILWARLQNAYPFALGCLKFGHRFAICIQLIRVRLSILCGQRNVFSAKDSPRIRHRGGIFLKVPGELDSSLWKMTRLGEPLCGVSCQPSWSCRARDPFGTWAKYRHQCGRVPVEESTARFLRVGGGRSCASKGAGVRVSSFLKCLSPMCLQ